MLDAPRFGFEPVATSASSRFQSHVDLPKILLVSAPTGYGKTVFLAGLHTTAALAGIRAWWFSSEDCVAPGETILDRLEDALQLAATRDTSDSNRVVKRAADIVDVLGSSAAETLLIFDHLDSRTDDTLGPVLDQLVFRGGSNIRIVVGSTAPPVFDIHRARLEGLLGDVGIDDLCFGAKQIQQIFAAASDDIQALDESAVRAILDRTEGWPAAVRIIRLGTQHRESLPSVMDELGNNRVLAALFQGRLLRNLDPKATDFLLRLGVFPEFSADLCRSATGNPHADDLIELLLNENALITNCGTSSYRFHPLLREFLCREAARRLPHEDRALVAERAATWCLKEERWNEAIHYSLLAGSGDTAAAVLAATGLILVRDRGQHATFIEWYERAQGIGAPVSLDTRYWYVWALLFTRRYDHAFEVLQCLESETDFPGSTVAGDAFPLQLRALRAVILCALDRVDEARETGVTLRAHEEAIGPFCAAAIACAFALPAIADLDFSTARRNILRARSAMLRSGSEYGIGWIASLEAVIDVEQGEFAHAQATLADALERVRAALGGDAHIVSTLEMIEAKIALELGDINRAASLVSAGLEHAHQHGFIETTKIGLEVAIRLWDGALDSFFAPRQLDLVAAGFPPRIQLLFCCEALVRLVQLGKFEAAVEWSQRFDLEEKLANRKSEFGIPNVLSVNHSTVLARLALLIAQKSFATATTLVESELAAAMKAPCPPWQVRLHLVKAQILMMSGQAAQASRAISRAISIAARRALRQPFSEHSRTVEAVILAIPRSAWSFVTEDELRFFESLQPENSDAAGPAANSAASIAAAIEHVETPTSRELEFLGLLEAGLSNQDIADRLTLTVSTVKWHLHNLYAKLGVRTRSAALAKARRIRLMAR